MMFLPFFGLTCEEPLFRLAARARAETGSQATIAPSGQFDRGIRKGEGFTILELNGAASEATNAYDSGNSLCEAYRTLFRQWELVFAIADENRRRGHRADPLAKDFL